MVQAKLIGGKIAIRAQAPEKQLRIKVFRKGKHVANDLIVQLLKQKGEVSYYFCLLLVNP